MKRIVFAPTVALLCVALTCSGCALVNGTTQRVVISTSVPDVKIVVDGRPVGHTEEGAPLVVRLKRNSEHIVTAQKEGYTSNYVRLDSQLCTLGILDVIGIWFFLLPGISLLTGGAFELEPSEVYIALDKKEATPPPPVVVTPPVTLPPPPAEAKPLPTPLPPPPPATNAPATPPAVETPSPKPEAPQKAEPTPETAPKQ